MGTQSSMRTAFATAVHRRVVGEAAMLRTATRCRSLDEFVERFATDIDESSLFVATSSPPPVGADRRFVFELADGTPVLHGRGRVIAAIAGDDRRASAGVRLAFIDLTPSSRDVHRALVAARAPAVARPHPNTVPRGGQPTSSPVVGAGPPPRDGRDSGATAPITAVSLGALVSALAPGDGGRRDRATTASPVIACEVSAPVPANPLAALGDHELWDFVDRSLDGEHPTATQLVDLLAGARAGIAARRPAPTWPGLVGALLSAALLGLGAGYTLWGDTGAGVPTVTAPPASSSGPAPGLRPRAGRS